MSYRKITILIDCENDQERDMLQRMADEVSNMRLANASQILSMYPALKQNKADFVQLFKLATGPKGPMGLVSLDGAKLLTKLTKKR